jgi:hypothetical protein
LLGASNEFKFKPIRAQDDIEAYIQPPEIDGTRLIKFHEAKKGERNFRRIV